MTPQSLAGSIFLSLVFENKRSKSFQIFLIWKMAKKILLSPTLYYFHKIEARTILTRRDGLFKAVVFAWVRAELFIIYEEISHELAKVFFLFLSFSFCINEGELGVCLCPIGLRSATSCYFVPFCASVVTVRLVCKWQLLILGSRGFCCWGRRKGRRPANWAVLTAQWL